ncbi:Chemotaxis protein CheA [Botrimarina colliarenosi]|uniref:histidine kinase n=1 Tax=Botrimarina colliarenosi TaxID=2528001 RepID=A0A5C6AGW2_9BACT|nr:chemotaxis protein CheW [Botrimarina colliarenosi]TWT99214.1 Chemotaxis protein CheA [Botrimarina colliarenosi]
MEDNELLADFVVEANEHLADIENQFLAIEEAAPNIDVNLVNEVFRAIHSIKGAAGFLGLRTVNDLAHNLENVLNMMRNEELTPTSAIVDDMLKGADALKGLIEDVENSNGVDVGAHITALERIAAAAMEIGNEPVSEEAVHAESSPSTLAETEPAAELTPAPAAPTGVPSDEELEAAINAKLAEKKAAKAAAAAKPAETTPAASKAIEPKAETKPAAAPAPEADAKDAAAKSTPEAQIRVAVNVLDSLMNLAGELVLSRNQLLQAVSTEEKTGLEAISARLDQITSELQEAIMQTRMQQIGTVFSRFPRVVRDLSSKLGKQCDLEIEGKEVEVDKTIVEAIGDPLTHLVRNSCDHGIELPEVRTAAGKPAKGTIKLKACYQAGKVRIEIRDDGGGIDPEKLKAKAVQKGVITPEQAESMNDREALRLIFAPGFSTAAEVTDVSGRGVGMDVVRTNIAKLGGTVDVESEVGKGSNIVVTLPLTLAIIPSLIVQVGCDRFAIPQVNIAELVRVRDSERSTKLGRVKNAEVLRLRGQLLPLVRLREKLGCGPAEGPVQGNATGATNVIVVDTGQTRFGLVVEALHDSEEIVVKPLGRHYKNCRKLAGATILGDGHVALILDIAGIAGDLNLRSDEELREKGADATTSAADKEDRQSMLFFKNNQVDNFAIPMDIIARIERVPVDQLDSVAGQEVLQYRDTTLPLMRLESCISASPGDFAESAYVVVYDVRGREVGLIAPELEDIREVPTVVDTVTFREPGVIGSLVTNEKTVRLLDLFELTQMSHPEWFSADSEPELNEESLPPMILLAEDSGFFRTQVKKIFEEKGYRVADFEDGKLAWEDLDAENHSYDVIVTDIEMPNMNGFELCHRVKNDPRFSSIPVIALTSLAGSADVQHGMEVGIDDYQIKMDRDKLLTAVQNFAGQAQQGRTAGSYA